MALVTTGVRLFFTLRQGGLLKVTAFSKVLAHLSALTPEELVFVIARARDLGGVTPATARWRKHQLRVGANRHGALAQTADVRLVKQPSDVGANACPPQTPPVSLEHQVLGFSSFWSKYPKRVGKAAALKAWKKNGCESNSAKILEALEKQHGYLTREGGKFIPNPSTWLNEGRWDDEPPMTLPGVSKHAQATIKNLEAFVQGKSS